MTLEEQMKNIWKEVLSQDEIGVNENIFDIGGTSLMLYQICMKAKEEHQLEITPMDLMVYPSISALVSHLEGDVQKCDKTEICTPKRRRRNPTGKQGKKL